MFWKQADYWPEIGKDYGTLTEPYSENDFNDTFKFLRKMCIMSQLFRKHIKIDSTYLNGLFKAFDKPCHDTNILVPDVVWDTSRVDNVIKMFPRFDICAKETKRWSSGYHTIISHSDIKKIVTCPPKFLLSYFDISSAEVR